MLVRMLLVIAVVALILLVTHDDENGFRYCPSLHVLWSMVAMVLVTCGVPVWAGCACLIRLFGLVWLERVVVLLLFRYHMTITMEGILTMLATAGAPLNDCSYSYACLYNKMLA